MQIINTIMNNGYRLWISSTKEAEVVEWLCNLPKITNSLRPELLNKGYHKSFFDFHVDLWTFEHTKYYRKLDTRICSFQLFAAAVYLKQTIPTCNILQT